MEETEKAQDKTEEPLRKPEREKITFLSIYDKHYKKLLIIPVAVLIFAILSIIFHYAATGDFINRDVTLKGGISITIPTSEKVEPKEMKDWLIGRFPQSDISVRALSGAGRQVGIIVTASDLNEEQLVSALTERLGELENYAFEETGPTLGASFFRETLKVIYISFVFMGMVVFLYFGHGTPKKILAVVLSLIITLLIFANPPSLIKDAAAYLLGIILLVLYIRNSAPSVMVILAVFSDVVITLAIVNLLGIKISTAGIAAFLMLIGYSVDTDILLSIRVLKIKQGTVLERTLSAMKTGLTMTMITIVAVLMVYIFSQSDVLKQIMLIILIGLFADIMNTWIQNAGILRWYVEKHGIKHE